MSTNLSPDREQPKNHDNDKKQKVKECKSTADNLLKFAGTWKGDDLEKCLEEVYRTRGETTF